MMCDCIVVTHGARSLRRERWSNINVTVISASCRLPMDQCQAFEQRNVTNLISLWVCVVRSTSDFEY